MFGGPIARPRKRLLYGGVLLLSQEGFPILERTERGEKGPIRWAAVRAHDADGAARVTARDGARDAGWNHVDGIGNIASGRAWKS